MQTFRDPVHNIIQLDRSSEALLLKLLDSKEMQRLRHIKQLGMTSFTYPGADHSRFSHSLGVCHLMKRFIEKIMTLSEAHIRPYQQELKEYRMLALASALLHDVGHGPFSHALERVTSIDHEHWTMAIITGDTEVHHILEGYERGFSRQVAEVIRRTHPATSVVKLLSSQLDTDRVDYLLRDSLMTGAGYGQFDLEWLIHVLRIGTFEGEVEVGLDLDKGLSIAEDFVMARYYMYQHVYLHRSTRSAELIVGKILARALELYERGQIALGPELKDVLLADERKITSATLTSFLQLTDHTLWHYFYVWQHHDDELLRDLCQRLIERRLYKSVQLPDAVSELAFYERVIRLAQEKGIPAHYIYLKDSPSMRSYTDQYLSQRPKDGESEGEKEASEQIVLFDRQGKGYELSSQSEVIRQLRSSRLSLSRIYIPEQFIHLAEEISNV